MNCNIIKKRFYDVPAFRASLALDILILIPSIMILVTGYNDVQVSLIISVSLMTPFILISFIAFFCTSTTIVFTKEYIIIKKYRYNWYNITLKLDDDTNIVNFLRANTLCISYYNNKKKREEETYIRCKRPYFDYIMSVRNW